MRYTNLCHQTKQVIHYHGKKGCLHPFIIIIIIFYFSGKFTNEEKLLVYYCFQEVSLRQEGIKKYIGGGRQVEEGAGTAEKREFQKRESTFSSHISIYLFSYIFFWLIILFLIFFQNAIL